MSGINLGVNGESVERVIDALVGGLSDDYRVLERVVLALRREESTAGLGYILREGAIERIERKIEGLMALM